MAEVSTRGRPEPLRGVVGRVVVLGPSVMRDVLRQRLKIHNMLEVSELEDFWVWSIGELTHDHIPGVVERLQVVVLHD